MALPTPLSTPADTSPPARPGPSTRDSSVDAARAVLLIVVVLLHAIMVGVGRDAAGAPVLENAMEHWAGFPVLTWFAQVMPLFFIFGGFAGFTQWTRDRARGTSAGDYVAARVRRLLVPAGGALTAVAVFLSILVVTGVPAEVVAVAGYRIGQPLWFLAVYLGASALVPVLVRAHERAPWTTIGLLALAAVTVDVVRSATGVTAIGALNLAFVWLLLQQLGFALAEGRFDRLRARYLLGALGAALAALAVSMLTGFSPVNLLAALNPPMSSLVLLGIAQLALFQLLRPALRRHANGRAQPAIGWINARAMTIYSWHMLVVVALAGALLLVPGELAEPLSAAWWESRPLWLALVVLTVGTVVGVVGGAEARRVRSRAAQRFVPVPVAVLVALTAVLLALLAGSHPAAWVVAAALIPVALASAGHSSKRSTADEAPHLSRYAEPGHNIRTEISRPVLSFRSAY
ncbi:acyltransferase family protein [Microbacterium gorillae]|uniref:acyltransferase family protein n=1 Tax=Microbacterium gorillae TaxID=1231063 RepID=UPI000693790E|nr:acyltransferase [Microbacterium gorillae]